MEKRWRPGVRDILHEKDCMKKMAWKRLHGKRWRTGVRKGLHEKWWRPGVMKRLAL
jgi:hypothetical protein